jgi:hypothetical protein
VRAWADLAQGAIVEDGRVVPIGGWIADPVRHGLLNAEAHVDERLRSDRFQCARGPITIALDRARIVANRISLRNLVDCRNQSDVNGHTESRHQARGCPESISPKHERQPDRQRSDKSLDVDRARVRKAGRAVQCGEPDRIERNASRPREPVVCQEPRARLS